MISRIQHFFRAGHIGMTPTLNAAYWRAPGLPQGIYPLELGEDRCLHTYNGSAALFQAATDMQLQAGDVVLLPAYCCGAELGPFEHLGCEMIFYDVHADMSVNANQVAAMIANQGEIRLLVVTHYLGIPQRSIPELAKLCRDNDVYLLEDCAHSLYCHLNGAPLGSFGDYAIFSPRKTLPLTEGGLMVSKESRRESADQILEPTPLIPRMDRFIYSITQGLRGPGRGALAQAVTRVGILLLAVPSALIKLIKLSGKVSGDDWLTPDVEGRAAVPVYTRSSSELSRRILHSSDATEVTQRRCENHRYWLECVAGCAHLKPVIQHVPEGCCPLYFVVEVADPAACVKGLQERDIEAFNWWQHKSELIGWNAFPVSNRLKESLLALPVHQQLTLNQIEWMARQLVEISLQQAVQSIA